MAESEVLRAPHVLEYPYVRSVGPVIGAFLTGLRDGRILGARSTGPRRGDGRSCRPPSTTPSAGADVGELVEVGPSGVVTTWSWAAQPNEGQPLDRPFAWALVKLDGASTGMLHVVDAGRRRHGERHAGHGRAGARRPSARDASRTSSASCPRGASHERRRHSHRPASSGEAPVTMLATPIRLDYQYTAGLSQSRFLQGIAQGKFIGQRCPECHKVYVPSRGSCPTDGVATTDAVELANTGTVTTYCVVNVPFPGQSIEIPYICAQILLDGANIVVHGADPGAARRPGPHGHAGRGGLGGPRGARSPPWPRSSTSGPTASPTPTTRPTRSTCERRPLPDASGPAPGGGGVVRPVRQRAPRGPPQRGRDAMPVVAEVFANIGMTKDDMGFICSGATDYLVGAPFSFVMALDAVGVWPPVRESHVEMDGAWALYEAWAQLQEGEIDTALVYSFGRVVAGRAATEILALQLDPYYMAPLWPDPVALAALQAQALIDAGKATETDFAAVAARSRARRARQPQRPGGRGPVGRGAAGATTTWWPPCGATPCRRITDGVRRRGAGRRRHGPASVRAPGVDHRHRPPHRDPRPRGPRPDRVALHPRAAGRARPGWADGTRSTWPSSTPRSPTRS